MKHKKQYQALEKQLKETGEKQISTSDFQVRQLVIRGVITEVCYNIQSTLDSKNKLPIDYKVTNVNDKKALVEMTKKAIDIIGNNTFNFVLDKGYYIAEQIHKSQKNGYYNSYLCSKPCFKYS
ncbi:hypothetical protein [Tenacibaculum ovolyticum]|uniref:hypothetical protein n=1 Tax=Tenacibaculum ovolyticum TaxID=104270 RepID=UPI0012FC4179|nr:hypothetical protein [Tenacibaculum ovolyticum]